MMIGGGDGSLHPQMSNLYGLACPGRAVRHQREVDMPIFITQGRFTREYVRSGIANPEDRHGAISKICEQAGGRMVALYFTLGHSDFTLISEMPDARTAASIALAAGGGGGIQDTVTTQAFTTAEAKELFASAGKLAKSYKVMGAS